jgi:hypothetical protein
MKIIPSTPFVTKSNAEYRVFDKIREAYVNNPKYIAFHSLNLTKHHRQRFGEVDFVIICEFGLFVFEVKGGGIEVNDCYWTSIDKDGYKHDIKNPFRQAQDGMHAIVRSIKESNKFNGMNIPIGYGVIFPSTLWNQSSAEWESSFICDERRFKNFGKWLKSFFSHWHSKPVNRKYLLGEDDIVKIRNFLRPNFELVETLHHQLTRLKGDLVRLTEEQYRYLDIVTANKQVLCSGGAGTGKTFLAIELSRRLACSGKTVLLVCKSNWLRRFLETRVENENVVISTVSSAKVDMKRAGVMLYDALIVDEGQDLFDFEYIDILDSLIAYGLENGEWYFFHDVNNQSGIFIDAKAEVIELLQSYKPVSIPLTINCRNSTAILGKIQSRLQLDMGNVGTGAGPDVLEINVAKEASALVLGDEITRLIQSGIAIGDITILSPLVFEESIVSDLSPRLLKKINKLDDFSVRSGNFNGIGFAEIINFKGLENEAIIVVDLPDPVSIQVSKDKAPYYVAMSRARSYLCVLWNSVKGDC